MLKNESFAQMKVEGEMCQHGKLNSSAAKFAISSLRRVGNVQDGLFTK